MGREDLVKEREGWPVPPCPHVRRAGARVHGYYASLLIRHGESVKTVQARLGHARNTVGSDAVTVIHLRAAVGDSLQREIPHASAPGLTLISP